MKVLLIKPNHTKDKQDTYVTFPSGLAYLAGTLIAHYHEVNILDLTLEDVDYNVITQRIKTINPDVIGISALSFNYIHIKKLVTFLRSIISCKIIVGGFLATYNYNIVLKNIDIDICVLGEGEVTFIELLNNLNCFEEVQGIAYVKNKTIVVTPPRELISNLNYLHSPAYHLFDIDKYSNFFMNDMSIPHNYLRKKKIHKQMQIIGGRGCPFNCNFCSKMFTNYRVRTIDNILKEVKYLIDRYNIDIFGFQDELLFLDINRIREFTSKIKELKINWYGDVRVNLVNYESLKLFKESGCLTISFGVESGSQKILTNMNKRITPEQIEQTIKYCLKLDLLPGMGMILGYPGENRETIQETIDLFKRVGYPALKFRYITPYPGSKLYEDCVKNGTIEDEEKYLESIGDGTGPYRFRFNFTEFTDKELYALLPYVVKTIYKNYVKFLLKHPLRFLKYMFQKNFMNPVYYYYYSKKHPTNYDKAAKVGGLTYRQLYEMFNMY